MRDIEVTVRYLFGVVLCLLGALGILGKAIEGSAKTPTDVFLLAAFIFLLRVGILDIIRVRELSPADENVQSSTVPASETQKG